MNHLPLAALVVALVADPGAASAQTVLFDTFNEANATDLFQCCSTYRIAGRHTGAQLSMAVPFVVTGTERINHLDEVDIALSDDALTGDAMEVTIEGPTSPDGHPHRVKLKLKAADLPKGGQCCVFQALDAGGLHLKMGWTYWLVVSTKSNGDGGWNVNSAGLQGPYQLWNGNSWTPESGLLPAVRLLGH